jgi:hypothetical protein
LHRSTCRKNRQGQISAFILYPCSQESKSQVNGATGLR